MAGLRDPCFVPLKTPNDKDDMQWEPPQLSAR